MEGVIPIESARSTVEARYLRPREAARYAGLSESELRRAIYAGELRAHKYRSKRWLIDVADLQNYIERSSVPNVA
jgi:excisionase family DNA binding protein